MIDSLYELTFSCLESSTTKSDMRRLAKSPNNYMIVNLINSGNQKSSYINKLKLLETTKRHGLYIVTPLIKLSTTAMFVLKWGRNFKGYFHASIS